MIAADSLFRWDSPVSAATMARWQAELDRAVGVTDRLSGLVLRWEAGDAWQPIQRFIIWQTEPLDSLEPWVRAELLSRRHPRGSGHYCGDGYCLCPAEKQKGRWVGGMTRFIDRQTWELYRDTGCYGRRWWVIQGSTGGHRFAWRNDEPQAAAAKAKGFPAQTPAPGDLPYAPFVPSLTLPLILRERRARHFMGTLASMATRLDLLKLEEQAEAAQAARAVWEWAGDEAERLWYDAGADLLPRYFEDTYGRVPTGTKPTLIPDVVDERILSPTI